MGGTTWLIVNREGDILDVIFSFFAIRGHFFWFTYAVENLIRAHVFLVINGLPRINSSLLTKVEATREEKM